MTLALSLTGKYQLVMLGQAGNPQVSQRAARLTTAVRHAFHTLGVNPNKFLVTFQPGTGAASINRRMPAAGVFFGLVASPVLSSTDDTRLETLLRGGALVIPVVENLTHFSTVVTSNIASLKAARRLCPSEIAMKSNALG